MIGKVVLTGGGTAGHVTANIALIPRMKKDGYEVYYIGSYDGIEKKMVEAEGIPYTGISTGKLRRYFDVKNFSDPIRVLKGYNEARKALEKIKPDIVFSKGGFVAVPVVWAARSLHIPVVSHESDMSPGLANRLCARACDKICCNFPETLKKLPEGKAVLTGSPIREKLLMGTREEGLEMTGFDGKKPVLMIIGGSLGSVAINNAVRKLLPRFLEDFDVVHVCGKNNLDNSLNDTKGYKQYEFLTNGLRNLYALADVVISRAGANVICELVALKKPNILIPLPLDASRGDQILNAESFEKQGFSFVLDQHEMEKDIDLLYNAVHEVHLKKSGYIIAMQNSDQGNGVDHVLQVLRDVVKENQEKNS
ncbi:UDP-N-acetylglucosamine-N-acetylmuramylpentapeptide N-acetylglucosamine transferase [Oribacterium sp. KHPX15]|nr:undecaprenyldiphospho-muramoylpentapeptide beta-N-acetylglucosaminyltransferase [Oribacterium sp. KHPX15]SEA34975.1 UDP-N-acetylglucosamine-N-acetylmuramylpentapeptide N-acetylglucosamine transferase [Oribacterium sp. KHPX15]